LAGGWVWHGWLPIIKHAWTSSMVLWAGGWSYLLLALFYVVIDILGFRRWAFPFIVIGSNAIFAYMVVHLVDFGQMADSLLHGVYGHLPQFAGALRTVTALLILWLILWYMYRKKTFVRV